MKSLEDILNLITTIGFKLVEHEHHIYSIEHLTYLLDDDTYFAHHLTSNQINIGNVVYIESLPTYQNHLFTKDESTDYDFVYKKIYVKYSNILRKQKISTLLNSQEEKYQNT